jgi:hypothetical protein
VTDAPLCCWTHLQLNNESSDEVSRVGDNRWTNQFAGLISLVHSFACQAVILTVYFRSLQDNDRPYNNLQQYYSHWDVIVLSHDVFSWLSRLQFVLNSAARTHRNQNIQISSRRNTSSINERHRLKINKMK